ncbi:MAG: Rrf2 family transcriptional regulator [Synergistes sp.]|nr:Rrf2 family transcriptional regulator [Synergistes sp.]
MGGIVLNPIADLPEPLLLGLHAIGELAYDSGKCLTTQEIAERIGTTAPYLSKVLQRLGKSGIIKSVRGPGGGYKLNCVPEETPLYPIFALLGGPFESRGCPLDGCFKEKCFIAGMMDELSMAIARYLESRTVADFAHYYETGTDVSIEISVITPSLGQKHPNFERIEKMKEKSNKQ